MRTSPFQYGLIPVLLTVLLLASLPAVAQETTGSITGTVTDASGAVIPGAEVTVTNRETSTSVAATTGGAGVFIVRQLAPGRYMAAVTNPGFRRMEVPDILVLVGKVANINVSMEVGQVEQTVQVVESTPLIDTTSTMIAQNVTAEEIQRLPKGRSFQDIAIFSPSVNTGEIEGGYQINGASAAENNYYIDGVSTNSLIDGSARQKAQFEYLQEVQVKTSGLDAEYGGALGGVVSAVTKSGGNDWHGDGHFYFYGNSISASPVDRLELDPAGEEEVKYIQDEKQKNNNYEVGGSIGGPLIKNKLFIYTSISPRWQRRTREYMFDNGVTPGEMSRKRHSMNWFNSCRSLPPTRSEPTSHGSTRPRTWKVRCFLTTVLLLT